jgi:hypothetical protein
MRRAGWRILPVAFVAVAATACASTATRELTVMELQLLDTLQARIDTNGDALDGVLSDLLEISREALADQHALTASIARAQLLESMRSPWLVQREEGTLAITQREVALYHLYSLHEAQRELLSAKVEERRAALDEVEAAHARLRSLVRELIKAEKVILAHLEQPRGAQIRSLLTGLLGEATAFREALAESDDPRLQELSERVKSAQERVERVQTLVERALEAARSGGS